MGDITSLIDACTTASESKSRAEALSSLLEALQRGAVTEGGPLAQLCATLASSITDNNVKVSGGAAAVAEHLGGSLPAGALRDGLSTLVPPLAELLGNAKVRGGGPRAPRGSHVSCSDTLPPPPSPIHALPLVPPTPPPPP